MQKTRFIDLHTEIPGPKSVAVHQRMQKALPKTILGTTPVIEHAQGSILKDIDGNTFIDLTGGLGCLNVGHCNPRVVRAIQEQSAKFLHTDFSNVPYDSLVRLAERLNKTFPGGGDAKTIFFNAGTEANENAVKVARLATGRKAVISFESAFHGRTLMALSLTSKAHPYKAGMGPFASEVYRVPFPGSYRCDLAQGQPDHVCDERCYARIERALVTQVAPEDVAAVIVEPVQGEGGFVVPPKSFLPWLRRFTEEHGILLIVDEVQCGVGRTGKMWATEHSGIRPDMLTFAKSIAGGLPLSGLMGRSELMDVPEGGQLGGTFIGNPLSCVAANAVLDAFDQDGVLDQAVRAGEYMRGRLDAMAKTCQKIGEVRGLGPMVGVEFVEDRTTKVPASEFTDLVVARALSQGVLLLTAGIYHNVIRFLQPLTTPMDVLEEGLDVFAECLKG